MWLRRIVTGSVFFFIQLLIVADILDRRVDEPTLDVDWTKAFAVTIVYGGIALLFILSTFYLAGFQFLRARGLQTNQMRSRTGVQYTVAGNNELSELQARRAAKIYLYDGIIDFVLFALLATFVGLLIDQLNRRDAGDTTRSWATVMAPLFVFLSLVFVFSTMLGVRVFAEKRYEGALNNTDCCSSAFGDVLICCNSDNTSLQLAVDKRSEKKPTYSATAPYHRLPCAFMCTPELSYGVADTLLSWAWYLLILLLIVSTALLTVRLDSVDQSTPTATASLVPLIVAVSLVILLSFVLLLSLCCCFRRLRDRPVGRSSILYKYADTVAALVGMTLLLAQLALLGVQIDADDKYDWQVAFVPAYLLFSLGIFAGCCVYACSRTSRDDDGGNDDDDYTGIRSGTTEPTSIYGVFNAVTD